MSSKPATLNLRNKFPADSNFERDPIRITFKSVSRFLLVPLWSGVNVAGVQFRDILPNIGLETDEERWYELSKEVVRL